MVRLIASLVSKKNKQTNIEANKQTALLLAGTSSKFPTRDYFRSDKILANDHDLNGKISYFFEKHLL